MDLAYLDVDNVSKKNKVISIVPLTCSVTMFNIGPLELILIIIVALIAVGPKKLPELARTIARTIQEFKRATNELRNNLDIHINEPDEEPEAGTETHVKTATSGKNGEIDAENPNGRENVNG